MSSYHEHISKITSHYVSLVSSFYPDTTAFFVSILHKKGGYIANDVVATGDEIKDLEEALSHYRIIQNHAAKHIARIEKELREKENNGNNNSN